MTPSRPLHIGAAPQTRPALPMRLSTPVRTTERGFQQRVMDYARAHAWLVYHTAWRPGSDPGFPDLVLTRTGRIIFADLKTQRGKLLPEQHNWHAALILAPAAEMYVWQPADWAMIEEALA